MNIKKHLLFACGIALLLVSTYASAAEVTIERIFDKQGNPRISADVKVGYKLGTVLDQWSVQPFAGVMYWSGRQGTVEPPSEWDDSIFFSAYANSDVSKTDDPNYLHCLVTSDSPLYEKARHLSSHANGSSGFLVVAEDPVVSNTIPKCLELNPSYDNTYGAVPRKDLYWYVGGWSGSDGEYRYLWAGIGPQPRVDGAIMRELTMDTKQLSNGQQYTIDAVDNSPNPQVDISSRTFHCTTTDSIYQSLVNSPSTIVVLGVQTIINGLAQPCLDLTVEISTYTLDPLDV